MAIYITHDVLDQMYKSYVRPHLDYGDAKRLELVQYSAALAVAGV